jgi:uncharacterized protein
LADLQEFRMLYDAVITQHIKMLNNLSAMFDKAIAHATAKKYDPETLLLSRLAPDQFPLARQVQIACDTAKFGAMRLTGKAAPAHPDTEKSISELRQRIASTIAYLADFTPADFAGAETKLVTTPRWEGKTLTGSEFALQHLMPNLNFHVATAYSILRHNGVDVGKSDYLGAMPFKAPAA